MNETSKNPNNTNESNEKRSFPVRRAIAAGAAILAGAGIVGAAVESNSNPEPRTTQIDKEPAPAPQDIVPGTVLTDAPQPRREAVAETTQPSISIPVETTATAPLEQAHTGIAKDSHDHKKKPIVVVGNDAMPPMPAPSEITNITVGNDAMPEMPLPSETPVSTPTPEQPQQ